MITGAQSVPGLGDQVAERLRPWRELAEDAMRRALGRSAAARLLPPAEAGHALVAGFFGLELLASLDGDRAAAFAVFDRMPLAGPDARRPGLAPVAGRLRRAAGRPGVGSGTNRAGAARHSREGDT